MILPDLKFQRIKLLINNKVRKVWGYFIVFLLFIFFFFQQYSGDLNTVGSGVKQHNSIPPPCGDARGMSIGSQNIFPPINIFAKSTPTIYTQVVCFFLRNLLLKDFEFIIHSKFSYKYFSKIHDHNLYMKVLEKCATLRDFEFILQ